MFLDVHSNIIYNFKFGLLNEYIFDNPWRYNMNVFIEDCLHCC